MKNNEKKNEANSKEIVAEIEKRFARHTKILVEQMRHDVKTVAEGHGIVIKKLEDHDKKFVELDKKIGKVESKLHSVESELHSVESELHSVKMAVMDTSHRVDRIEKKLDESLGNHEKRITKLEEKVLV